MSNFRLTVRPGVTRSGKVVQTGMRTIIAPNTVQPNNIYIERSINGLVQQVIPSKALKPAASPIQIPQIRPQETQQPISVPKKIIAPQPIQPNREILKRPIVVGPPQTQNQPTEHRDIIGRLRGAGNNRILIIVANGPSVNEIDLLKLKDHPLIDIMMVNKPDKRIWPTNYWIFCDQTQFQRNEQEFNTYTGTVINTISVKATHKNQAIIKILNGRGFSKNLFTGLHIGRSTTYAAMQVAYWMNYKSVYVVACDMCVIDGKSHFYGANPDVDADTRQKRFNKEADFYLDAATRHLSEDERKKFIFCSTYNQYKFMEYFTRLDQKLVVDTVLERANNKL